MMKFIPFAAILLLWANITICGELPDFSMSFAEYSGQVSDNAQQPEREIGIFPNPVTDGRINITSSEDFITVQILNITGKIVFNQNYQPNTSSATIEFDKFEKGIYLVRVVFSLNDSFTQKIIVK
jgi:hypothetical protein